MSISTLIGVIMTIVAVGVYIAYKIGWIKKQHHNHSFDLIKQALSVYIGRAFPLPPLQTRENNMNLTQREADMLARSFWTTLPEPESETYLTTDPNGRAWWLTFWNGEYRLTDEL